MRDFIERILRMPRAVIAVMVILLIGGVQAYLTLPKESFPAIDIPYFYVATADTGVSPSDVDRLITKPIVERLKDLDDLDHISSTSTLGYSAVMVEMTATANKNKAEQDIRAKLDGIAAVLPSDATATTVTPISLSNIPSINVAVFGDVPERTLVQHAKDLQTALEAIPDVQSVSISGTRDEIMQVTIDASKLDAYGLTASQLLDALARNNIIVPGGTIDTGKGAFNVQVPGVITSPEDVYTLPIKTDGNTVVTFGDVGTVTRTFADATSYAHVDGQPAITLGVIKKLGTNVISISDEVRKVTGDFTKAWPQGLEHSFLTDQADSTKSLYQSLQAAVLTAVALVLITCVATLGLRPALMIGTSIPISFMIAFLVVQMLGMTVNMMIMFGLVLAVGVLVDDPIVVVEYAERKIAEGVPKREAFIQAARKMFVPVVSATFTTLGAFVPLLFWPGIIGKFMSYLPIIVIVVMCASLLSALIFMPVIGGIIARTHIDPKEKEAADIVMYPDKFDVNKVRGFIGHYVRFLAHLLHWPIPTLAVGFGIVVAIFGFYVTHPTGTTAFPPSEPEFGTVNVIALGNYSPIQTRDLLEEVEKQILQVHGIQDEIMTFAGNGDTFGSAPPPNTIGQFQLQLLPWNDRVPAAKIFDDIRDRTKDIAGIDVEVAAQENGPPAGKDINLRVESDNYADLAPAVAKLGDYVKNQLGDTTDYEDGRPSPGIDWQVTIDRVAAARYGIGVRELSPYVQLVTDGVKLGTYRPDDTDDELDIRVRLPEPERSFATLDNLRIATTQGLVPVSNFIKLKAIPKVASIVRYNENFAMTVAANITDQAKASGVKVDNKIKQLQDWQKTQVWPSDVKIVYGGAAEQINDTNTFIVKALFAALALIAFVLLVEYNSFYQVLVTLSTVVMSLAGVLLGMEVLHMSFSAIMTGLGIVALAGIVVKNGIVLIDTYNHYRRDDHVEPVKAMLITASQRIRPVLLTATVTALGVIPMALNVEFDFIGREITINGLAGSWFVYLSAALVSGLFVSTALTLIMVPVMITAPNVIWGQMRSTGRFFAGLGRAATSPFRRRGKQVPVAPAATVPEGVDSAARYMSKDGSGLVAKEQDGVTVVTRQAAE
jgi:multidrug efflux pump